MAKSGLRVSEVCPVGHLDSKTSLEIYAQVQKRVSRTKVHLAFDELLASAAESRAAPEPARRI